MANKPQNSNRVMSDDPTAPAASLLLVTKSNSVDIVDADGNKVISRSLLVNQDTNAKLTMFDGTTIDTVPLQKGYNHLRVRRVWLTGTDSVAVLALY